MGEGFFTENTPPIGAVGSEKHSHHSLIMIRQDHKKHQKTASPGKILDEATLTTFQEGRNLGNFEDAQLK